jgi:dihydrofolate reductase
MRKLVITQNVTVDGSIEMLDDWFDPLSQDEQLLAESHRQDAESDAMLLGRQTFEDFRSYWPQQTADTTGITDYLNLVEKYVVSTTMSDPQWTNSTVLCDAPMTRVRDLKALPGKDIVVTGSITLTHALIAENLVDEYRLFVYPAVQGRGRGLFPPGTTAALQLSREPMSFPSGVVVSCYRPGGTVIAGFAPNRRGEHPAHVVT